MSLRPAIAPSRAAYRLAGFASAGAGAGAVQLGDSYGDKTSSPVIVRERHLPSNRVESSRVLIDYLSSRLERGVELALHRPLVSYCHQTTIPLRWRRSSPLQSSLVLVHLAPRTSTCLDSKPSPPSCLSTCLPASTTYFKYSTRPSTRLLPHCTASTLPSSTARCSQSRRQSHRRRRRRRCLRLLLSLPNRHFSVGPPSFAFWLRLLSLNCSSNSLITGGPAIISTPCSSQQGDNHNERPHRIGASKVSTF